MKEIVVLGSTNTDMVVNSEHIPVPGETVLGGEFFMNPGGKGANQAVAAARAGGNVRFIAKVGNDLFGRETQTLMEKEGITPALTVDPNAASGVALILVDAKGENCISVASGANMTITDDDIAPQRAAIESASALLMQLESPVPVLLTAAKWAFAAGVPVILNPAPAQKLPGELLATLSLITPNETEAQILTGIEVTDEASAARAADALHALGVKNVIITLGSRGSFLSTPEGKETIPAKTVKAVDTTAAGDCYNGALTVALTEGKSLRDAAIFATAAAAISVTRKGAQASCPFRSEIL